jgi:hypothetical protein
MRTEFRLVSMTPEEIEKLPYPDTARMLGGVYMPFIVYDSAEEEAIEKAKIEVMRQQFQKDIAGAEPLRSPIFEKEDE